MLRRVTCVIPALVCAIFTAITLTAAPAGAAQTKPAPAAAPVRQVTAHLTSSARLAETAHYLVRDGDTLSAIGQRLHRSWEALWWVNRRHITNPDVIHTGQALAIPPASLHGSWLNRRALAAIPTRVMLTAAHSNSDPAPVAASQPTGPVAPVGGSFEQCVIQRESGGDPTAINLSSGASGLFGMLLSTWDSLGLGYPGGAYTAPVSVQERGFAILYARDGTSPWAPYDGC